MLGCWSGNRGLPARWFFLTTTLGRLPDDLDWDLGRQPGTGARKRTKAPRGRGAPSAVERGVLLHGDAGPSALERLLGLVGGFLVGLLENGLRRAVDQVLGLLEAQAGELADDLDDLDLLVAGRLEDDVELVLLGGRLGAATTAGSCRRGSNRHRGSGGDAEGLLELLHEIGDLDERLLLEGLDDLVVGQGCHVFS